MPRARRSRRSRRSRPTSRSRTSSRPRPRWRRSCAACRSRRWSRTCTRGRRPASRPTRSARGCRARAPGAWLWRRFDGVVARGLEQGRREYNDCRARLGLAPLPGVHTGLSRALTLVGDAAAARVPAPLGAVAARRRPAAVGAARRARRAAAGRRPGRARRAVDRAGPRARAAARGARRARARAGARDRHLQRPRARPAGRGARPTPCSCRGSPTRARCPRRDVVVTHGGHGTLVRALSCGCAVVVCPAGGDMAENAARADWAGVGVRLPRRLLGPRTLRLAVRRALGDARHARARTRSGGLDRRARRRGAAAGELEAWAGLG